MLFSHPRLTQGHLKYGEIKRDIILSKMAYYRDSSGYRSHKKVLLRERKRHTARRVASARYAALSRGDTPSQVRGVPHPKVRVP